jgi:hypothetical protein
MKHNCLDIDRIAFFGRTYVEYMDIFGLDDEILKKGRILDCPAGASSFTAEAHQKGFNVTACDVLYSLSADELFKKGKNDMQHVFEKFDEAAHLYVWDYYKNKNDVMTLRTKAIETFYDDFAATDGYGRCGHYVQAELPYLPFHDESFSLVLSGNFLFLYGDRLDLDFHISCIKELLRVCSGEVRLFPLTGLDAKPYPHMGKILGFLRHESIRTEIVEVPFEFQRGANKMMRLERR